MNVRSFSFWLGAALVAWQALSPQTEAADLETGSAVAQVSRSGSGGSYGPVWSADGRTIAFASLAQNLTTHSASGRFLNIHVRNLAAGETILASINSAGVQDGNGNSVLPSLAAHGRLVAFESEATDLVNTVDENRSADIFVRDLAAGTTRLISVAADGSASANGPSRLPQMSEDGRFIIFESMASNLVTNDFNGTNDLFIHELASGTTSLISVNADGTASADGASHSASVSANGAVIAFVSHATNLVAGVDHRRGEVYVRQPGVHRTFWAGISTLAGEQDPQPAQGTNPVVTPDGRFVAFKSSPAGIVRWDLERPTNTVFNAFPTGSETPTNAFVFEDNPRHRLLPAPWAKLPMQLSDDGRYAIVTLGTNASGTMPESIQRVDFESFTEYVEPRFRETIGFVTNRVPVVTPLTLAQGATSSGNLPFLQTAASADGSRVIFLTDLTGFSSNGVPQLYAQLLDHPASLLSTNLDAKPDVDLSGATPVLSRDGLWAAYETVDPLVTGDLNNTSDIYIRNLQTGETILVTERALSQPAQTFAGRSSLRPGSISADGRWLALSAMDAQGRQYDPKPVKYPWIQDRRFGTNQLVGTAGLSCIEDPVVSDDGRYVAYIGRDLPSRSEDFVVRFDRQTGQSETFPSLPGWSLGYGSDPVPAYLAGLSADGRFLAFRDRSRFLLQVHDFLLQTNIPVGVDPTGVPPRVGTCAWPVFSSDNRWIAFSSTAIELTTNNRPGVHVRDLSEGKTYWLSEGIRSLYPTNTFAFSADSHFIVFARNNQVILRSLASPEQVERVIATNAGNPAVSGDGRFVACELSGADSTSQSIVRFDTLTGESNLISRSLTGTGGNGISSLPVISADGRFVAFASRSSDLAAGDTNGVGDVFVRDTRLQFTLLVSSSVHRVGSGNGPSWAPIMAGDGRTVVFKSLATDLLEGDYNLQRDVFVLRLRGDDTDRDGLDDDWEQAYFGTLARGGDGDFDHDGMTDLDEFMAGTSPIDDESILRVLTLTAEAGGAVRILWQAVPGRTYQVQYKSNLEGSLWEDLPGGTMTATGVAGSATDPAGSAPSRFYRVRIIL